MHGLVNVENFGNCEKVMETQAQRNVAVTLKTSQQQRIVTIRLKMLFGDEMKSRSMDKDIIPTWLKHKSRFDPQVYSPTIEAFQQVVIAEVMKGWEQIDKNSKKSKRNLTLKEHEALIQLSNDTFIITKKADKGGGIVIMNWEDYIKETEIQLQDEKVSKNYPKTLLEKLREK